MLTFATLGCLLLQAAPDAGAAAGVTSAQVLERSAPSDWRALDPERTLYVELPQGRVVIELAPAFAPAHVQNIRTLAREHYFDGLLVVRSQDNYVAQWGDPEEDPARAKSIGSALAHLPAEFSSPSSGRPFARLADGDVYAPEVGWSEGFPVGRDPKTEQMWLAHCYGDVGAGRGNAADSSNGTELYVVTGHSPRHLDRNITSVGRVVRGMERLSSLPRGAGPMGFYEKADPRVPLKSVRLAATVPEPQRIRLEVLRTDTATFQRFLDARRTRREEWFVDPVGHIELCNVPIPVREAAVRR